MNPFFRFSLCATLTTCLFATQAADARPPVQISHPAPGEQLKWDAKKFMHLSELRPGMRGYALTVFKGTKISRFGIEILGIVSKFNEGKDYIMFRATDGPPVTRALGIAHGMSGSPIYINGRLVGAISLGNEFARDPIGFATPIEDMFDAWSPDLPARPSSLSAAPSQAAASVQRTSAGQASFGQLDMPLSVSGMNALGVSRLQNALGPFHFSVMAGGGSGAGTDSNPLAKGASLVPGSAVGVSLVQGDIDMTATGTVTYRDGNRLLLFGHPFTSLGPIDAALTTAYVVDIYPSYQASVKFGSPIKTVGRIFQDRPFSVGGVIGPMPQMIPVTISVNDQSIKRHKNFAVQIINHPLLTGQLVSQVADAAIQQVHGQPGDSMAQVTLDVDVEEIGHVRRTNTFYDALGIDQTAIADLDSLLRLLAANPFYPLSVKSVKMAVTIQNRHDTAEIDHLFVKQSRFAPGDTVEVGVVLKPYKQPLYTRMISVKIPQATPDGALSLSIQGGGSEGGGVSLLSVLMGGHIPEPTGVAANVSQLAKQWAEKPHNDDLVAHLTLPTSAISIQGEKLSGLPPTFAAVMQSNRSTGLRTERDEVKVTQSVPYIVTGSQSLTITVRKKDLSEAPRSAASSPSSSAVGITTNATPTPADSVSPTPLSSGGEDDEESAMLLASPVGFAEKEPTPAQAPTLPKREGAELKMAEVKAGARPSLLPAPSPPVSEGVPRSGEMGSDPVKPVGRLPSVWRQAAMSDFAAGTLQNVAVTSLGDVRLSPLLEKVADTPTSYVWAMQPDGKGAVYLATGDGGNIYRMNAAGEVSLFYKTGELEVTALAMDTDSNLFAGTAPNGRVFRIAANGKGEKVWTTQEKYVTALNYDAPRRNVIIATGGGTGRVYLLRPDKATQVLFTTPEAHILSLATDKNGTIYAGSAPDGIVYKITPDGKSSVFYDGTEPNISSLATDSVGNVYAGTSPTGTVYRIASDGTAKRLLGRAAPGISSLKTDTADSVYAASGSTVYKINPDDSVQSFVAQADEQFLSLALDPAGSAVYAGTGTVGSVYKIAENAAAGSTLTGIFQSTVHDTGGKSRWGTLSWTSETTPGSTVTLQTRTGDVERPDNSWSAWSAAYTSSRGQTATSPPARFVQYQATLTGLTNGAAPRLRDVSLYYLPRNHAPAVLVVKPVGGDALSKAALLQWASADPDKDTMVYDVSYSADGGKTWVPIKKRALPAGIKAPRDAAAQSQENLDKLANVPPAIKARIAAQVLAAAVAAAAAPSAPAASTPAGNKTAQGLKETSFSWDTTEVADGTYQIQVIASDSPSNPQDALTGKSVSGSFLVANSAPRLTLEAPLVGLDKTVTLRGVATTGQAFVRAVQGRADGGDFAAASADDGLFDSPQELWTLILPALSSGSHKIEVQVLDRAGNSTTHSITVRVP